MYNEVKTTGPVATNIILLRRVDVLHADHATHVLVTYLRHHWRDTPNHGVHIIRTVFLPWQRLYTAIWHYKLKENICKTVK